ncbi:MAG: GMC family oxidoreductase [Pseudomonadota bacterium]
MITSLDEVAGNGLTSEIAIIGAGAVGILIANELAARGRDVILVESGGVSVQKSAMDLNRSVLTGRNHLGIHDGRARVLGGTTTLWGGQLIAFGALDFEARPWLGVDAWPITLDDVKPYYIKTASALGLPAKSATDEEVWSELNLKVPQIGSEFAVVLTRWLKTPNFARYFDKSLRSAPNLHVITNATATAINTNAETGQVETIDLRSTGGKSEILKAKTFIIASGTIEASRLMLCSAQKDSRVPWSDNPWVGASFQDHLDLHAASVHPINAKAFSNTFDNIYSHGFKYQPKIALSAESQKTLKSVNIAAAYSYNSSLSEHFSNLKMMVRSLRSGHAPENLRDLPAHLKALSSAWAPIVLRYLKDRRIHNLSDLGIQLVLHCEQVPLAESRISLSKSERDSNGMPLVELDWRIDGRELESMATFCEILDRNLQSAGLAKLAIMPKLIARDPSALDASKDTNHQCGGLRMSRSASDGVTNSNLQVHGAENLYIAGAAAFPSSSFANPTFTAMALGMRLCDHLHGLDR